RCLAALGVLAPLDALELHALELAALNHEALGHVVDDDLDLLFLGVLQLPGRRLEELARAPRHDLDVLAAEAARRAAAVHRGVADADDQHALANRLGVAERDALQPVDADVDVLAGFVAAGDLQLLAARRAGADEDRVELRLLVKQRLEA